MSTLWTSFGGWFVLAVGCAAVTGHVLRSLGRTYPEPSPRREVPPAPSPVTLLSYFIEPPENAERDNLARIAAEREFTAHFQPIVDLTDGAHIGVEALTRFDDGANPEHVFRRAGQLGVGLDMELATLRVAIENAAFLHEDGFLAVNMSPSLLTRSPGLADLLDSADRPVVVELSEQEAVEDYDELRLALDRLGVDIRLSVDDAGSGFASLKHILQLHPAYVKFDRAWVHDIHEDPARRALIAGLRHFADTIGATVVAEGVEKPEERDVLLDLGVPYGQGWLVGRPCPAEPAMSLVR